MPFVEKSIYSGAILEIEQYSCNENGKITNKIRRGGETSKEQAAINLKNKKKKLMRLMCCNFKKGDFWITLTYEDEPSEEKQAYDDFTKFFRRFRAFYKKKTGKALKLIAISEKGDKYGRLHHHFVCNKFDFNMQELLALWGRGRIDVQTLDGDPYYRWLMIYMEKNERSMKNKKSWRYTKNLEKPYEKEKKVVKRAILNKPPNVPKGYYLLDYEYVQDMRGASRYIVAIKYDRKAEIPKNVYDDDGNLIKTSYIF